MSETPGGVKITATAPDGTTLDVTEVPMVGLAEFCGFDQDGGPSEYIEDRAKDIRSRPEMTPGHFRSHSADARERRDLEAYERFKALKGKRP